VNRRHSVEEMRFAEEPAAASSLFVAPPLP
jgi:hypothetical protein